MGKALSEPCSDLSKVMRSCGFGADRNNFHFLPRDALRAIEAY